MSPDFDAAFFDREIDRGGTSSSKWEKYAGRDVLPFWVADMDFAAPGFILDALRRRLDHPILGYTERPASLVAAFQDWLARSFGWEIEPDWVVWLPGVVAGLNLAARTLDRQGSVLVPTPVYHPFLDIAMHARVGEIRSPMAPDAGRWQMDFDHMARAADADTRMLLFCNPQNPTGRCYTRNELRLLAEFAEARDLVVVSDEIHCSIVLDESATHLPIAHAFPEIRQRTISLFAATKTYNIPGLGCAAAVIPDPGLRQAFLDARSGLLPGLGPLALLASEIAFRDTSDWVPALTAYLRGNLEALADIAGDRLAHLEGTYLAWIDVRDLGLADTEAYFADHGLGLSPGAQFGRDGYVRFNFACPRSLLDRGLTRLRRALEE